MTQDEVRLAVIRIASRISLLAKIAQKLENSVTPPTLCHLDDFGAAFRYSDPTRIHIIILKFARIVSTLNACTLLFTKGFTQEIQTLLRTIIEFNNTIKFLSRDHEPDDEVKKYIEVFFSNFNPTKRDKSKKLPKQKSIHISIEKSMLKYIENDQIIDLFGKKLPSESMSDVYFIFSEYIHGSYPVLMDMFNGVPARLSMYGQPNSPKDRENLECIDTVLSSVELSIRLMLQRLKLQGLLAGDRELEDWYSRFPKR